MHKIEFESHVLVGDVVFVVARKPFNEGEKKIYKPCPVCENKRKVWTNTEPTMQVDCPRCTGSRTKGGESISVKAYSVQEVLVKCISFDEEGAYINHEKELRLCENKSWVNSYRSWFVSKEEATAYCKKLNAEQSQIAKDFLNED